MCGATLDLTLLSGAAFDVAHLISRFQGADSFQTLLWMVEPLVPNPQALLLHVVEVIGWGLAGYGVGLVGRQAEGRPRPNWSLLGSLVVGLLGLGIGSLALPMALGLRETSVLAISVLLAFLVQCSWSGMIAVGLYGLTRYLMRPVVMPSAFLRLRRARRRRGPAATTPTTSKPASLSTGGSDQAARPWVRPQPQPFDDEEPADIIMIDLD
jgi:hypothetical protein